ncbi:MAG TPA: hypothetical protein VGL15_12845 [Vicinamibacteria bacterium]|jgi:hypothetical protein
MTIVTAADRRYFRTLCQLLRSLERHRVEERHAVVVYDLGLDEAQLGALRRWHPRCDFRRFPFEDHPAFVGEKARLRPDARNHWGEVVGFYAWKPLIVASVLEESRGPVLWLDSATLARSDLDTVARTLEEDGVYVPVSGIAHLADWIHPATLRHLKAPLEILDRRSRGGGICGFHDSFPAARELVCEWKRYALVRECLAPEGASLSNHRYDQAILTVLLYRYERERGLRLTSDELDINSIHPVSFCRVRRKVRNGVPLWLDPVLRAAYAVRSFGENVFLRLQRLQRTRLAGLHRATRENFHLIVRRNDLPVSAFVKVPKPFLRSHADPFVLERDGRGHVFFEEYDKRIDKGRIATFSIGPDLICTKPQVALEQPYHMSYPFLFEEDRTLYMIPETTHNRTVDLYACERLPDSWRLRKRLLYGIDAADSTLLLHDGLYWLFTSVRDPGRSGRYLCIFFARELCAERWSSHPVNRRRLYEQEPHTSGRGAGGFFRQGEALVRPAQRNPDYYGQSIVFNRIDRLTETEFSETPIATVTAPPGFGRNAGTHHLSSSDRFVAMDIRDRFPLRS